MKVNFREFDGVYCDEREGYEAVSYLIVNETFAGCESFGTVLLTLKLDTETKSVGIEKMLLVPCMTHDTIKHIGDLNQDRFGYWFKTDTPNMCFSEEELRIDLSFIMKFATKLINNVSQPPRVAMYMTGALEPDMIDIQSIDKRCFTYEHAFCRHWVLKSLPNKLMRLATPKMKVNVTHK